MKKSRRKFFEQQLEKLTPSQKRLLYKRASNLRKAAQINARKQRTDSRLEFKSRRNDDNLVNFQKHSISKVTNLSIDDWALKVIEEEGLSFIFDISEAKLKDTEYIDHKQGTIINVGSKGCKVMVSGGFEQDCLIGPDLAMTQKSDISVGDIANYALARDGSAVIQSIEDRKSKLSRPDPLRNDIERVVAANVDVAVIVAAIKQPPFRSSLVDRYLIAADKGGITPLICVNKIDLLSSDPDAESEMNMLIPYRELGLDIISCSAETGEGVDELVRYLKGKLCVFVGHSGTGKSSLLNAIRPEMEIRTGEVHEATGLGRHTTTNSMLYELDNGIRVIDTPGIREFGLYQLNPDSLKWYFDEFDEYAEQCKYTNCSHTHEPDCAVKWALEDGRIPEQRYDSYLRILDSLEETNRQY